MRRRQKPQQTCARLPALVRHSLPWHPSPSHPSPWHPSPWHPSPWHPSPCHPSPWHLSPSVCRHACMALVVPMRRVCLLERCEPPQDRVSRDHLFSDSHSQTSASDTKIRPRASIWDSACRLYFWYRFSKVLFRHRGICDRKKPGAKWQKAAMEAAMIDPQVPKPFLTQTHAAGTKLR